MTVRGLAARILGARGEGRPPPAGPSVWSPLPPACPPGWAPGPPQFVGVGAQRCGTSWWFKLLAGHPAVTLAPGSRKEVHFFDRFADQPATDAAVAQYARHFPRPRGGVAGEWTPRYMHDVWTPRLLHRAAPDARLLVMLRDPVERFRSGLAHERAKTSVASPLFVVNDAFARGLYHRQLVGLLAHFDAARVLILQFEACLARPEAELRRTYAFLELDAPSLLPADLTVRVNETLGDPSPLPDSLRADLVDAYRDDTARLVDSFPGIDTGLWPNMRRALP